MTWRFLLWIAAAAIAVLIGKDALAQIPPAAEQYRYTLLRSAQSVFGANAPTASLAAQIAQESAFRADAVSRAGARGLSQYMPATAASMARIYPELQPVNEFDPRWSLLGQSLLMRDLMRAYRRVPDECQRACFASTAYNGGPKRTNDRRAASDTPDDCWLTRLINPGIHPANQHENETYPVRIFRVWEPRFVAAGWGRGWCDR